MKTAAEPVGQNDDPLLPPLTTEQRDSLRESIRAEGIHTPVVQDQHGHVLDGFERLAIAGELGLRTYPGRTAHCPDDRTRRHLRLQLGLPPVGVAGRLR
jgi:ParB-like chromosome segregation protein Spo0J